MDVEHEHLLVPSIDLFASQLNKQVNMYFSFAAEEGALGTDAFVYDWSLFTDPYLFCPFSVIPRALQKIRHDKATVIMVVPVWQTAVWWASALDLLCQNPLLLPRGKRLLHLPQDPTRQHQLLPKMQMTALRLTGQSKRSVAYRKLLRPRSWATGNPQQCDSTMATWPNGKNFASKEVWIPITSLM